MRSLTELAIEVHYDDDEDHAEITVAWVYPDVVGRNEAAAADFGFPTDAQGEAAATYVAGLLGRLAFAAAPWIAWTAQEHQCRGKWYGPGTERAPGDEPGNGGWCCAVNGTALLTPVKHWGDGVELWISIPTKQRKAWLARVRGWLQILADPGS
jgi:hypothetical protein